MFKLSKSRKKNNHNKLANSRGKATKQRVKPEHMKVASKGHQHHASTLSLVSNAAHNASQCSLIADGKLKPSKKATNKHRESSLSLLSKDKGKKGEKKVKNKNTSQNHNKSIQGKVKSIGSKSKPNLSKLSPQKMKIVPINKNTREEIY